MLASDGYGEPLPLAEFPAGVANLETLTDFMRLYATLSHFHGPFGVGSGPTVVTMGITPLQCVDRSIRC